MTYFLDAPTTPAPRRNPDLKLSDNWSGLGAAVEQGWQAADVGAQRSRQITWETQLTAEPAAKRLGIDALNERYVQEEDGYDHLRPAPTTVDDFFAMHGNRASEIALELAREKAAAEPDAWKDLDLSPEGIEARVTDQRKKELEENQQIIAMSPNPGRNSVLGEIGAAIADPVNIALAPLGGGGGSLLRVMGREALVNAGAEALQFPARQRVAKELGQAAPDFIESVTLGAIGGAALGGVFHGVGRAVEYFKTRSRVHVPVGESPINSALAANAAEDALIVGDDPIEAARAVVTKIQAPYLLENPINPTRPPLISEAAPAATTLTPSDMAAQGIPPVETSALPPMADAMPQSTGELVAMAQRAVDQAAAADTKEKNPLIDALRRSKPIGQEGSGSYFPSKQVHPEGALAQDLRAAGITSKTHPGLFSRKGSKDLDNLPADEWESQFPGIMDATGTKPGETYLNQQGLSDLIKREAGGDSTWLRSRADAQKAQADLDAMMRQPLNSQELFQAQARAPGGLYIDRNAYEFTDGFSFADAIERDVNAYLDREWAEGMFMPSERHEILKELTKNGGDVEYLVERILSREADYVDLPKHEAYPYEIPEDEFFSFPPASSAPDARGSGAGAAREQNTGATGGSRADQAGSDRAVEQTAAGQQSLIPGVKPITQRQRLEAAQQRVLGGGPREADSQIGGLFDPGAKSRTDLFSDAMAPAARDFDARRVNDLREEVARQVDNSDDISMVYTTEKGSTYKLHRDGTTSRDKAARSDVGHEGDFGKKKRSAKTIYVSENASTLSAAGIQGLGAKGARVAIRDGKATLVWWNDAAGKWGAAESGRDIPFFTEPAIGRYPLELWKPTDDVPGYKAYSNMHAGNKIVDIAPVAAKEMDLGIVADDGRALNTLDDILTEIDEMDALEREIAACRLGKAPE